MAPFCKCMHTVTHSMIYSLSEFRISSSTILLDFVAQHTMILSCQHASKRYYLMSLMQSKVSEPLPSRCLFLSERLNFQGVANTQRQGEGWEGSNLYTTQKPCNLQRRGLSSCTEGGQILKIWERKCGEASKLR